MLPLKPWCFNYAHMHIAHLEDSDFSMVFRCNNVGSVLDEVGLLLFYS